MHIWTGDTINKAGLTLFGNADIQFRENVTLFPRVVYHRVKEGWESSPETAINTHNSNSRSLQTEGVRICVCHVSVKGATAVHGFCRSMHDIAYGTKPEMQCLFTSMHYVCLWVFGIIMCECVFHFCGTYSVTQLRGCVDLLWTVLHMRRCVQLLHAQSVGRLKPKRSCSYLLYLNQRG